ncbi:MAG TPA: cytochrome c [Longimicrobiaceae bacterium]|nr:cytochrome c [Longimicrobiaceae bacterium]
MTIARELRVRALALAAAAPLLLAACTDWAGYDLDIASGKIPQLANMRSSVVPDPYAMLRLPAPGAVPVENPNGDLPAPFTSAQLDSVAPTLANPFAGTADARVLERGAQQYHNNCFVCHGPQGGGDGPVAQPGKVIGVPAINTATAAARSDGYLYAVVVAGRGLMPPYGARISHADRWAIVTYLRELQARGGAAAPAPAAAAPAAAPAATTTTTAADTPAVPAPR